MPLSGADMTAIMDDVINDLFDHFTEVADSLFPSENKLSAGALPGDILPPGMDRLEDYWAKTPALPDGTNPDVAKIIDPNYELRLRQGLDQPPVNPYWVNQLRIPGQFTLLAKDFMALNQKFIDSQT